MEWFRVAHRATAWVLRIGEGKSSAVEEIWLLVVVHRREEV